MCEMNVLLCSSTCITSKVGERQQRRKVAQMKTYMSSTVKPCLTSHGLTPEAVTAKTSDGKVLTIPFSDAPATTTMPDIQLAAEENGEGSTKSKALYLLDRFAVSDQFYHELAQVCVGAHTVYHLYLTHTHNTCIYHTYIHSCFQSCQDCTTSNISGSQ